MATKVSTIVLIMVMVLIAGPAQAALIAQVFTDALMLSKGQPNPHTSPSTSTTLRWSGWLRIDRSSPGNVMLNYRED